MTNVKVQDLNYHHYSTDKYDKDIFNSIPYHKELHEQIIKFIKNNFDAKKEYAVLDLGAGTGITSKMIQNKLPNAKFDLNDFSKKMLLGAKKKFGKTAYYILGDYSKIKFRKKYDIIISVIGIHHQNHKGKRFLFKKIYSLLKPGGIFIFGDLVTYKNSKKASLNQALHFYHLVKKSTDKKTLKEWAHHHCVLNDLTPIEDQVKWMRSIGFDIKIEMLK